MHPPLYTLPLPCSHMLPRNIPPSIHRYGSLPLSLDQPRLNQTHLHCGDGPRYHEELLAFRDIAATGGGGVSHILLIGFIHVFFDSPLIYLPSAIAHARIKLTPCPQRGRIHLVSENPRRPIPAHPCPHDANMTSSQTSSSHFCGVGVPHQHA